MLNPKDLVASLLGEAKTNVQAHGARLAIANGHNVDQKYLHKGSGHGSLAGASHHSPMKGMGNVRAKRAKEVRSFVDYDAPSRARNRASMAVDNQARNVGHGLASMFTSKDNAPMGNHFLASDNAIEAANAQGVSSMHDLDRSGVQVHDGGFAQNLTEPYEFLTGIDADDDELTAMDAVGPLLGMMGARGAGKGIAKMMSPIDKGLDGKFPMLGKSAIQHSADDAAEGALEHPALGDDVLDIDDLIDNLGLIPGGSRRAAKGLADPKLHTGNPGNFQKFGPKGPGNTFKGEKIKSRIPARQKPVAAKAKRAPKVQYNNDRPPADSYEGLGELFDMNPYS